MRRLRHRCFTLAVLALAGLLAGASLASAQSRGSAPFTVMSVNVRYDNPGDGDNAWPHRRTAMADYLREQQPDLIGMQEVLHRQLVDLMDAVPGYAVIGVGRDDGAEAGEYCPVFVRKDRFAVEASGTFWLSSTPNTPGSVSYGNTLPRIVTWAHLRHIASGKPVHVYNTHFDHASADARLRSAIQLQDSIAARSSTAAVIVTGDFNTDYASAPLQALVNPTRASGHRVLRDSFWSLQPSAFPAGTYHPWDGDWTGAKIDFVLVGDLLTVLSADIMHDRWWGRWLSDHAPVSTKLLLSGR